MITIVGAGPAGSLLAILLARRGLAVELLERRADPRLAPPEAGRSINLALAARGIRALRAAGVADQLAPLLVTMRGRRVHETGKPELFSAYGQREHEVIYSVSRADLTARLIEVARELPLITMHFDQQCAGYGGNGLLRLRNTRTGEERDHIAERIVGADGAGSALRQALSAHQGFRVDETRLPHDYKELTIPLRDGRPQLAMDGLHIWPRGSYMLIALPNADGTFTATLFLERGGQRGGRPGFDTLIDAAAVLAFFQREFPEILQLIPDLADQFQQHPQGMLGTVHSPQWRDGERLLLIGDAAHAIVPFHGQGMNCAFEDCRILDELLADDASSAFGRFEDSRHADCEAIAQMALENYDEMRDSVRSPLFQRQKELALALERAHPTRFIPRYAMVMFHDEIPYAVAMERGRVQQGILDELTATAQAPTPAQSASLVEARLPPLSAAAG